MNTTIASQLAPNGILRAGINMSNFLLVTSTGADGQPQGVSPDIAAKIASLLDVSLELKPYPGPGELADGIGNNEWDIGNIAAETERAKTINFSNPYCEIQATYLLPADSTIAGIEQVDAPGNRIVVKQRSAYDLWLTENIRNAEIVRVASVDGAFDVFINGKLEVMAGLRPKLLEQQSQLPGSRMFEESFTAVQQSIGCAHGKPEAARFLNEQIEQWISSGFIQSLIDKHGVTGKLSVATVPG